jgi:MFS family permease
MGPSRYASPVLVRVYLSTLCAMFSYSLVLVVLPFRFQALGLSVVDYGLTLGVLALGMLVTEGVWGAAAFRIGRAAPLIGLGVAVLGLLVLVGLARTFLEFALTLGLYGALIVFPVPLGRWLALTAGGPGTSGRGTGRYVLFFGIGLALGSGLGPAAYEAWGFFAVILIAVVVFAVSVVLIAYLPWERADLPPRSPRLLAELPQVFTRHFAVCAALVVLAFMAYSLPTNFLQYYSVGVFGGNNTDAGYVIGAYRATQLLAGFLLGSLVDRRGPVRSAPFGFLLLAAGALGTLLSHSYAEMIAASLVFATGAGWLFATLLPLVLEPVPRGRQGLTVGTFGSFEDLGLLIGPVLISATYASRGPSDAFAAVALVALAGAGLAILARWVGVIGAPSR